MAATKVFWSFDNPDLYITEKIYLIAKLYGERGAHIFLGTIIWVATYALFIYYKELIICHWRKDEKFGDSHLFKMVEYQQYLKYNIYFTVCLLIIWVVLLFLLPSKFYTLFCSFIIFYFGYIAYSLKYYLLDYHDFDLFDDFMWIYKRLSGEVVMKEKQKSD